MFVFECMKLVPPRWIVEPTDRAFAQGSDARIECKADGKFVVCLHYSILNSRDREIIC